MIKSFFWKGGNIDGKNQYQANNCPDKSADGLFAMCHEKGNIKDIPEIPGLVVHAKGHIGVYVGGGYTIEMRGFAYDCVKRKVTSGPWTEWGKLPSTMIEYANDTNKGAQNLGDRTLARGCYGADVKELQNGLLALGYSLPKYGADGDYGKETQSAVAAFQKDHDMEETGIFDASTFKAFHAALHPDTTQPKPEPDTPDGGSAPAWLLIIEGAEEDLRKAQALYGGTLATVDNVRIIG